MPVQRDALPTEEEVYRLCLLSPDMTNDDAQREAIEGALRVIEAVEFQIKAQLDTFYEEKQLFGAATFTDDWLPRVNKARRHCQQLRLPLRRALGRLRMRAEHRAKSARMAQQEALTNAAMEARRTRKLQNIATANKKQDRRYCLFVQICREWHGNEAAVRIWHEVDRRLQEAQTNEGEQP